MEYRLEMDSMGEMRVPANRLWGAQTQRSLENFPIGSEKMPREIILAFAYLKKAAAAANLEFGMLDSGKSAAIQSACDEILSGGLADEFPLAVWQTGSGTQSNMNVNEVLAHRASQLSGLSIHPNDDVNMGQSSNDTFPTAMHVAAVLIIENRLLPSMVLLEQSFETLIAKYGEIVKIGRTHLQDATPLTMGQEISGWAEMLRRTRSMLQSALTELRLLAIGGTAVGTGLNAHVRFGDICAQYISKFSGSGFSSAPNKFHALTSRDAMVFAHGAMKALAADLMKVANDVRWLSGGPRCGIGELNIPANEPGSSIMPGKVNPTQCEAVTMVAVQVIGNDTAVGMAASQGNFQLNVFMPVTANCFIQSAILLSDAMDSFRLRCVDGITPNTAKIKENLDRSLMLVTALSPKIGYDNAAKVAKTAFSNNSTLKETALSMGLMTETEFNELMQPERMTHPLT